MTPTRGDNAFAIAGSAAGALVGVFVGKPGVLTFFWILLFAVLGFLLGHYFDRRRRS